MHTCTYISSYLAAHHVSYNSFSPSGVLFLLWILQAKLFCIPVFHPLAFMCICIYAGLLTITRPRRLWHQLRYSHRCESAMPRPADTYTHDQVLLHAHLVLVYSCWAIQQFEKIESPTVGGTVRCRHCERWQGSAKVLTRKKVSQCSLVD